jgi:HPt (histidine-containing phosphotransfer) domain-containing protein
MMTDLKYLQQMTGGDNDMIKEMIELFLLQLDEVRSEIGSLVECHHWHDLSRLAHKIKSSAMVMGIMDMADDMKELEMLAKEAKNVEEYPEYIARLYAMIDLAGVELSTYLNN